MRNKKRFGACRSTQSPQKDTKGIVDAAVQLQIAQGPGLLESVYTVVLQKNLQERTYSVEREIRIPVEYEGVRLEMGFRADLII